MAKYIDLKKAIEAIDDLPNCYNGYSDTYDKAYIIGTLEEVPTADVVEVVRCKYCAHHEDIPYTTNVWCEKVERLLPEDWFCADGERREEDRLVMPPADGSTIKVDGERRTDDGEIH